MNKHKNFKVFVVGFNTGYARWIQGELAKNMKEADVVLFTGGEDISPSLYGETAGRHTFPYDRPNGQLPLRDEFEVRNYKEALELGKPMWGTCRGAQLLCALAGGKLVQDMSHHSSHKLYFYDNEYECVSNTLHHQMQYPYTMKDGEDYKILAHAIGQSPYFLDGNDKPLIMPETVKKQGYAKPLIKEPEFVYYPKIKSLGIQGHPEMMSTNSDMVLVCHAFLNLLIEDKLNDALLLNIPVKSIISRAWDFNFTKEENALLNQIKEVPIEV